MDPFSHFLLGYLLGFGIWGPSGLQYVVAAAVAGGLPDADIVFFPLAGRFPLLRHRGLSHSLVGVTVIAAVGTFVVPLMLAWAFGPAFAAGEPLPYFVALEVGGLSHVLLDSMDHWSVPILAPFSPREYSFDADRLANFGAMAFTVVAYGTMLYERGRVPLPVWVLTTWLLLLGVAVFFVVRLGARYWVERYRRAGGFGSVIPQVNPLHFLLYDERSPSPGRVELRLAACSLMSGAVGVVEHLTVAPLDGRAAIDTPDQAISASYATAVKASWMLGETNRFAVWRAVEGGFDVYWYSLEVNFFGRSAGVLAHVDRGSGSVTAKAAWRRPHRMSGSTSMIPV